MRGQKRHDPHHHERKHGGISVTVRDLACSRGGRPILAGVSFELASGQMLVLRGPNGVGKTTLLRTITGLIPVQGGELRLQGAGEDEAPGRHCHYIAHQNANKPQLTVRENLGFWSRYLGGEASAIDTALAGLDLEQLAHLPAAVLSAGQKRRLALARLALAFRPLWLLDEPTVGLDVDSQAALQALMRAHLDSGGMIIASTHVDLAMPHTRTLHLSRPAQADQPQEAGA